MSLAGNRKCFPRGSFHLTTCSIYCIPCWIYLHFGLVLVVMVKLFYLKKKNRSKELIHKLHTALCWYNSMCTMCHIWTSHDSRENWDLMGKVKIMFFTFLKNYPLKLADVLHTTSFQEEQPMYKINIKAFSHLRGAPENNEILY